MNKISAILIDDEEGARDVLSNLLARFCPEIDLLGQFCNIPDAVGFINDNNPQLVFLDIEMPNYAGFEIVKFFDEINFEIIFVTAYDKYALRAFEIAAVDYILKPVDIDRLKDAVTRVKGNINLKYQVEKLELLGETLQSQTVKNIIVIEKGYQQLLATEEIIAIEAQESYSFIHTLSKKFIVSKNLKHFETIFMDDTNFIRVHKSWIIAKNHMLKYSKSDLIIILEGGINAKLSKYKKSAFEEFLLDK
jgi:two-component system LytT family response regulator